jgi:hypothetical protein
MLPGLAQGLQARRFLIRSRTFAAADRTSGSSAAGWAPRSIKMQAQEVISMAATHAYPVRADASLDAPPSRGLWLFK